VLIAVCAATVLSYHRLINLDRPGSAVSSGDGAVVLAHLIRFNLAPTLAVDRPTATAGVAVLADHW
jgi:hypothetical protein